MHRRSTTIQGWRISFGQREHEERAASAEVFGFGPKLRHQSGQSASPTDRHGDVLLAIYGIGDGRAAMAGACLITPKLLATGGIKGEEVAFGIPSEEQVSASSQRRGEQWILRFVGPLDLAGERVARVEVSALFTDRRFAQFEITTEVRAAHLWLLFLNGELLA